jgi:hypothetical protein
MFFQARLVLGGSRALPQAETGSRRACLPDDSVGGLPLTPSGSEGRQILVRGVRVTVNQSQRLG